MTVENERRSTMTVLDSTRGLHNKQNKRTLTSDKKGIGIIQKE
jgi:hypothetical protein